MSPDMWVDIPDRSYAVRRVKLVDVTTTSYSQKYRIEVFRT